ncbi:MAG: lipocalin family protein [Acidobacteria bacterium]|nr:lipocalin family protein [Acidobacteriota bacterium]
MGWRVTYIGTAAAALLLLLLFHSARQSPSASIVGRWRSLETTKGGIGAMYEFHSDGIADFSLGAVVEAQWRIENNQLVLPPDTVGGAERKSTLKWHDDNNVNLSDGSPVGIALTRVGVRADERNPIIGEWTLNQEMAGRTLESHWLFYGSGRSLFLMPFKTEHGTYKVSGSALHIEASGTKTDYKFELTDNHLTLYEPSAEGISAIPPLC